MRAGQAPDGSPRGTRAERDAAVQRLTRRRVERPSVSRRGDRRLTGLIRESAGERFTAGMTVFSQKGSSVQTMWESCRLRFRPRAMSRPKQARPLTQARLPGVLEPARKQTPPIGLTRLVSLGATHFFPQLARLARRAPFWWPQAPSRALDPRSVIHPWASLKAGKPGMISSRSRPGLAS